MAYSDLTKDLEQLRALASLLDRRWKVRRVILRSVAGGIRPLGSLYRSESELQYDLLSDRQRRRLRRSRREEGFLNSLRFRTNEIKQKLKERIERLFS